MTTENKTESPAPKDKRKEREFELLFRELRQLEKMERLIRENLAKRTKSARD